MIDVQNLRNADFKFIHHVIFDFTKKQRMRLKYFYFVEIAISRCTLRMAEMSVFIFERKQICEK